MPEIKVAPVGIERDNQIAEMKYRNWNKGDKVPHFLDPDKAHLPMKWETKPYSTNIATAMELELPCNKFFCVTHKFSKGYFVEIWHREKLVFDSDTHKTESAAWTDARSGAYIKMEDARCQRLK
jgi:hypothetical protein